MANNLYFQIFICFMAGLGAGLGTGFAGLSAAVVITPLLVAFLDVDFYVATAIALTSDILASAISAIMYGRKKNINFSKNAIVMLLVVLVLTVVGSFTADKVNTLVKTIFNKDGSNRSNDIMNLIPVIMTFFMGLKFIIKPIQNRKEEQSEKSEKRQMIESILVGIYIGFVAGFVGAGGGLMLLFALTIILRYDLKTAVGTSVFIMSLTAAVGAGTHYYYIFTSPQYTLNWKFLVMCIVFTFVFAQLGSWIANRASNLTLNRITGGILIATALTVIFATYIWPLFGTTKDNVESIDSSIQYMKNYKITSKKLQCLF